MYGQASSKVECQPVCCLGDNKTFCYVEKKRYFRYLTVKKNRTKGSTRSCVVLSNKFNQECEKKAIEYVW